MARFNSLGERTFSGGKRYILFVCTGNTCRSPMAYGVLKKLLAEANINDLDVRTAGVMTVPGLMPTQECRQLLLKEGIDISTHRSCQLTSELIKRASLVLGMTSFHVQMALRMTDCARGKTFLLKEYTGGDSRNDQVQDPMGCTLEIYKKVYREIRTACKRLMKTEFVLACMPPEQAQLLQEQQAAPAPSNGSSKKKRAAAKAPAAKMKTEGDSGDGAKKSSAPASKAAKKDGAAKKPAAKPQKAAPAAKAAPSAKAAPVAAAKKPAAAKGARKS